MTYPLVARVFFAIDLPPTNKNDIGKFISELKKKSKSHHIRWTRPENLHITLQFLSEIKGEHIDPLITNVRQAIKEDSRPIHFNFGKLHLFPNPYRPRVIVLEISGQEAMGELAHTIGEAIQATHYPVEARPFRAHLTLGRIKQQHGINLQFLDEVALPALDEVMTKEVILFRSEPQPHGSKYTILERIAW